MDELLKSTLKNASKSLTSYRRRAFQAQVSLDYFNGNPRKTERELGWSRQTVIRGLNELQSGFICYDQIGRGNHKTEEKYPLLKNDIQAIVEPHSQTDPSFRSTQMYTKKTAKSVRQTLIKDYSYNEEQLPTENTINSILNRLGYSLKRVQKTKPLKKIAEVDEIFENLIEANQASDKNKKSLRISIDSKAKIDLGEYSRNGLSRDRKAKKALDHDMGLKKN